MLLQKPGSSRIGEGGVQSRYQFPADMRTSWRRVFFFLEGNKCQWGEVGKPSRLFFFSNALHHVTRIDEKVRIFHLPRTFRRLPPLQPVPGWLLMFFAVRSHGVHPQKCRSLGEGVGKAIYWTCYQVGARRVLHLWMEHTPGKCTLFQLFQSSSSASVKHCCGKGVLAALGGIPFYAMKSGLWHPLELSLKR